MTFATTDIAIVLFALAVTNWVGPKILTKAGMAEAKIKVVRGVLAACIIGLFILYIYMRFAAS